MRKLLFLIAICALCSCGDQYKAKHFIKNLDKDCVFLFQDINDKCANVYYISGADGDCYTFYRYDVRTELKSHLFYLYDGATKMLYHNCDLGIGDVFYLDDERNVMRHNLKTNTAVCVNDIEGVHYTFVAGWNRHLIFYDETEGLSCDERIVDYDTRTLASNMVMFHDIDNEHKKYFVPECVVGYNGLLISMTPYLTEDGMDLRDYLYHYSSHSESSDMSLERLCTSDRIWVGKHNDQMAILAEIDINTVAVYDLYGRKAREFYTLHGWQQHRGVTSGNKIAESYEHNIMCYIANDDDSLISTINVYYYDGNTGQELELNRFVNHEDKEVSFVIGTDARKNIKVARNNSGLVFYGETDWLNEYSLFYFDFATRKLKILDRGRKIKYDMHRFEVEHHNATRSWYNDNGKAVSGPSYWERQGAELGKMFNVLFGF